MPHKKRDIGFRAWFNEQPVGVKTAIVGGIFTIITALITVSIPLILGPKPLPQQTSTAAAPSETATSMPTQAPPDMVLIEAGEFMMGNENGESDQRPIRTVYLKEFWIDIYEVTNEDFQKFINERERRPPDHWQNGQYTPGRGDYPIVGATWYDAFEYCSFVSKRLPTEAEWEKAARGTDGRIWPWGSVWDDTKANTWEANTNDTKLVGNHIEGKSPYGVADMAGNVWEWVNDWYQESYYSSAPDRNPPGPVHSSSSSYKVVRGGWWGVDKNFATTFYRIGIFPPDHPPEVPGGTDRPTAYIGFRCACEDCR
jgi:iron(II)-dependent oxidoreductase